MPTGLLEGCTLSQRQTNVSRFGIPKEFAVTVAQHATTNAAALSTPTRTAFTRWPRGCHGGRGGVTGVQFPQQRSLGALPPTRSSPLWLDSSRVKPCPHAQPPSLWRSLPWRSASCWSLRNRFGEVSRIHSTRPDCPRVPSRLLTRRLLPLLALPILILNFLCASTVRQRPSGSFSLQSPCSFVAHPHSCRRRR